MTKTEQASTMRWWSQEVKLYSKLFHQTPSASYTSNTRSWSASLSPAMLALVTPMRNSEVRNPGVSARWRQRDGAQVALRLWGAMRKPRADAWVIHRPLKHTAAGSLHVYSETGRTHGPNRFISSPSELWLARNVTSAKTPDRTKHCVTIETHSRQPQQPPEQWHRAAFGGILCM